MKETDMPQFISEINTADIPADSIKPDNDFPADELVSADDKPHPINPGMAVTDVKLQSNPDSAIPKTANGYFGLTPNISLLKYKEGGTIPDAGEVFAVPDGIRVVGIYAFYNCKNIKKVILPDTLEMIETLAFCESALDEITIPASVQRVARWSFVYCSNLKKITLECDESVLDPDAFEECRAIEQVICRVPKPIDEQMHLAGKAFLEQHLEDGANYHHRNGIQFCQLANRCARGDSFAMNEMAIWFENKAENPFASRFYLRASNYWRYRAYKRGNKEAAEWFSQWFSKHNENSLESILPEHTNDHMNEWYFKVTGKMLNDLGFFYFDPKKHYEIKQKLGDNIVEVTWPDETSRDGEIYWTYLDDNMQEIKEIKPMLDTLSSRDDQRFIEARELARKISRERMDKYQYNSDFEHGIRCTP